MSSAVGRLLEEETPGAVRALLGNAMAASHTADFAVRRIRLHALDLTPGEIAGVRRCRVLLGRLDIGMVADAAEAAQEPTSREGFRGLLEFLRSGRVEVRASGGAGWTPDFAVMRGPDHEAVIVGAIYFGRPDPPDGAALTCVVEDSVATGIAQRRFDQLWDLGYDVTPIVTDALEELAAAPRPPTPGGER